ncbi:MAG: DNA-directed RNA polymerase subunit omega [Clostridia bacterium]|nr:DNA-directed RNA polymerase subunit omega [Clostridia bacterium]
MEIEKDYVMMEPPIDTLTKKVGNKFLLTCLVSKRAKQLNSEYLMGEPSDKDPKVISIAAEEVYDGKVSAGDTQY